MSHWADEQIAPDMLRQTMRKVFQDVSQGGEGPNAVFIGPGAADALGVPPGEYRRCADGTIEFTPLLADGWQCQSPSTL